MMRTLLLAAAIAAQGAAPASSPQSSVTPQQSLPAPGPPAIPLGGAFIRPGAALDAALWSRLAHITVNAVDHSGVRAAYDGVRLADVLHDAGAPVGASVRGKAARAYVLVSAADGYAAIFTLAELDPPAADCAPAIVSARDGAALSGTDGPAGVVAPCDRTHARWVRGVTKLTVIVAGENTAEASSSER